MRCTVSVRIWGVEAASGCVVDGPPGPALRATARLERLVRSQRQFVADASHQLRTPLTGLRLRLEAVQASRLEPEAAADLEAALAELDRLAQMITELLELIRAGERESAAERLSLADVTARAAVRWSAAASQRGQRLIATGDAADGGCATIAEADADRIVDALVENALLYSPAGSDIEIAALPAGLEVRDRGAGLAPGEGEQVFERFHRGSAGRQGLPGSGLGLPIARELARRWGADVTLRPRPGGGTVAAFVVASAPGKDLAKPAPDGSAGGVA